MLKSKKKKGSKNNSVTYQRGDGVIQIIIRDEKGNKEMKLTANQSDKKTISRIGTIIKEKYGIDFTPTIPDKGFFDF